MATPIRPERMTGFLPILLLTSSESASPREKDRRIDALGKLRPMIYREELDECEDRFLRQLVSAPTRRG